MAAGTTSAARSRKKITIHQPFRSLRSGLRKGFNTMILPHVRGQLDYDANAVACVFHSNCTGLISPPSACMVPRGMVEEVGPPRATHLMCSISIDERSWGDAQGNTALWPYRGITSTNACACSARARIRVVVRIAGRRALLGASGRSSNRPPKAECPDAHGQARAHSAAAYARRVRDAFDRTPRGCRGSTNERDGGCALGHYS